MQKFLITGATGNIGKVLIRELQLETADVYAGVRNIPKAQNDASFQKYSNLQFCELDFEKKIYPEHNFTAIFLLRPPQLASVNLFKTFLEKYSPQTKIVFLSVQGADKKTYLPHAKIEKLILEMGFPHVFIRSGYFMENLLTTLWNELKNNQRIYLPAGNLKLNWITITDIAKVAKQALIRELSCEIVEVLNQEYTSFSEVVREINIICGTQLKYQSPTLFEYILYNVKQKQSMPFTLVMLLLHYLPRFFAPERKFSKDFFQLTQSYPTSLQTFIKQHQHIFAELVAEG